VTFIARNNLLANEDRRIDVVKATMKKLENMPVSDDRKEMMKRNVGVAIGSDPVKDVDFVRKLVAETDCRMVRIYTINGDPRVVETAKKLREEFGDQLEIFVGQVTDIKQAIQLAEEAKVDGLIFGHGGGRQCTSGENGMAINTLEQIYDAVKEKKLNGTSIVVEGGVGTQLGGLIHLGVDCILYNNQIGKGCIEVSDLFLEHKKSKKKVHPYNGSASAPTMIIEESIGIERTSESGRTLDPEGKPGLMFYEEKAGTMAYWWFKFLGHAARVLVDYGVMSMEEFREKKKTRKGKEEIYRMVTAEAANKATAYGVAA
jgi:hypothetical protein